MQNAMPIAVNRSGDKRAAARQLHGEIEMDPSKRRVPGDAASARAKDVARAASSPRQKLAKAETAVTNEAIYAHALLLAAF